MIEPTPSTLAGRVIFVLATPETGADWLVRALDHLPGVTAAPVPTHLASQGIDTLLDTWDARISYAMGDRADAELFLDQVRVLADAPLAAWRRRQGAERVVEHSPDHISHALALTSVYPDASFVHLVRDGRQVVSSLASPLLAWPPWLAARRWCDDQRAVAALDNVSVHTVRVEDLFRDPAYYVGGLASRLDIDADSTSLQSVVDLFGSGDRSMPSVSTGRVGTLGYEVDAPSPLRRWAAQVELGPIGEVAWTVRGATRRFLTAARES
jgi:hypothetical protein